MSPQTPLTELGDESPAETAAYSSLHEVLSRSLVWTGIGVFILSFWGIVIYGAVRYFS
jgi:hypothetical protein